MIQPDFDVEIEMTGGYDTDGFRLPPEQQHRTAVRLKVYNWSLDATDEMREAFRAAVLDDLGLERFEGEVFDNRTKHAIRAVVEQRLKHLECMGLFWELGGKLMFNHKRYQKWQEDAEEARQNPNLDSQTTSPAGRYQVPGVFVNTRLF